MRSIIKLLRKYPALVLLLPLLTALFAVWLAPRQKSDPTADPIPAGVILQDSTSVRVGSAPTAKARAKIRITVPQAPPSSPTGPGDGAGAVEPLPLVIEAELEADADVPTETVVEAAREVKIEPVVEIVPKEARSAIFGGGGYQLSSKRPIVVCGAGWRVWRKVWVMGGATFDPTVRNLLIVPPSARFAGFGAVGVQVGQVFGLKVVAGAGIDNHRRGLLTLVVGG